MLEKDSASVCINLSKTKDLELIKPTSIEHCHGRVSQSRVFLRFRQFN